MFLLDLEIPWANPQPVWISLVICPHCRKKTKRKKRIGGVFFTVHQIKSEFEMVSDTVLGVEWSKSNPVAPRGRGVWTIPLNDIPSLGNRKQDSTLSPEQVPFLLRTAKRHPTIRQGKCFCNNRLSRSYCTHEDNGTPKGQLCYPHTTGSGLAFSAHYPRLFTRRLLSGQCAGEFCTPCLELVRLRFTEGWWQLQTGYILSYKEIKPSKKSFC